MYIQVYSFIYASAMLQDEEVEVGAWWGKRGGAAQAVAEEEEEYTDYSPTPARKGKASGPKKRGSAAQAMAEEEEDKTDYSPSLARKGRAAGPKKSKQAQEGRPVHPNRKKEGGPCALCFATSEPPRICILVCVACHVQPALFSKANRI